MNEARLGVRLRTLRPVTIHRCQSAYRPVIGSFCETPFFIGAAIRWSSEMRSRMGGFKKIVTDR